MGGGGGDAKPVVVQYKFDNSDVNWLAINTVRCLAADMVQKANSGHPGAPMGCAPMAHVLWSKFITADPSDSQWFNRDRFVLSNGHGCALQYIFLHLLGYKLSLDDLKAFRQLHSKTPGHPEAGHTDGVEVTTGPLGQGFSNAVGLAIAEKHLAATFNRPGFDVVDNYTYVIVGDGCLQEGVCAEAASLAGHLGLGKLIVLYDDNLIQIDGSTELAFTEDVCKRFESYGFHTQTIADGNHELGDIERAIANAKAVTDKPSLIKIRTVIGYGSENQGTDKVHGAPLGDKDVANVKSKLGFDPEKKFEVPDQVKQYFADIAVRGKQKHAEWDALCARYAAAHPDLAAELKRRIEGRLPDNWKTALPSFTPKDAAAATRKFSQKVLNNLAKVVPELMGGSADLTGSNYTNLDCSFDFQKDAPLGRYLRFGVREHAMAAICNGLQAYGGVLPFCATFLNFIGYALGAVRLSALSHFGVLYIMTHDSIGLGEDGPTHQPIESLITCRATPNLLTLRPADGNETSGAYAVALENRKRPSVLALSRQNLDNLEGTAVDKVALGGYVIQDVDQADVILIGTGSELVLCVEAAKALAAEGVKARVVSMVCTELFDEQTPQYRQSVLLEGVPALSVEAGSVAGWAKYAHASLGIDTFGMSAPAKDVYKYFGLTGPGVADKAKKLIAHFKTTGLKPHPLVPIVL
eukprot:Unigene4063_Nuclearia_a/m.12338 Unigene4063_Nuclearia_a/g.12338  ORF Unigene4063_Nuclearia_a/g.12338 Unigene4063_Nuclearia_a/m.12338 type:complete len:693 (+) Unigene4063_Nuclearia_a:119-2197(+)